MQNDLLELINHLLKKNPDSNVELAFFEVILRSPSQYMLLYNEMHSTNP